MTVFKEKLTDLKEKYEKAEKLVEEDSKHDSETEPFKSHYAARDILIELQNNIKNLMANFSHDDDEEDENNEELCIYRFILGFIYKDTGRICVWAEELSTGEMYLQNCIDLLEPVRLRPEAINAYLGALNQIGILWSIRQDAKKSNDYLTKSESIYAEFKELDKVPLTIYDIFGTRDEIESGKGSNVLEKTHTLTLYYLAQIIGTLGDLDRSADYCHVTLKRQLEYDDYEPIDWSLNAATLSQYYFKQNRNTESRHHLAAATYMMEKYESEMYTPTMSEDERAAVLETFRHRSADIDRCWAKYGLNLLCESKSRLMNDQDESPKHTNKIANLCKFSGLDLVTYENMITDQFCLMYDDAKPVFLAIKAWLDKAKEYYTSDSEASEYAKIIQDISSAYKHLAFFEFDESSQCKLHKRRADVLEELLELLNPVYYLSICRELWYELGLSYTAILDIKLDINDRGKSTDPPNPHALTKINTLCNKSIARFQSFIASYKDKKQLKNDGETNDTSQDNNDDDDDDAWSKVLPDDELEPILFAYFQIARLYYKIMTPDRVMTIGCLRNSLKYYQQFVKGCDERPETIKKRLSAEYGVCREMTELLPLKIQKLNAELC